MEINRRRFIQTVGAGAAGLGLVSVGSSVAAQSNNVSKPAASGRKMVVRVLRRMNHCSHITHCAQLYPLGDGRHGAGNVCDRNQLNFISPPPFLQSSCTLRTTGSGTTPGRNAHAGVSPRSCGSRNLQQCASHPPILKPG